MNALTRLRRLEPGSLVAAAVALALAVSALVLWPSPDQVSVTGRFTRAVGLFPGSDVRRLNTDLAAVSEQLDGERGDLQSALKNLAVALDDISTFVKDNRTLIRSDIARLTSVTGVVVAKRQALTETLTNAPAALSNLQLAYNPRTGTLDTRNNLRQLDDPGLLLCSILTGPGGQADSELCRRLVGRIRIPGLPLPLPLPVTGSANAATPGAYAAAPGPAAPGTADPTLGGLLPGGTR